MTKFNVTKSKINQDFLDYIESKKQNKLVSVTKSGYPLGEIPPAFELPEYKADLDKAAVYDTSYDLRSEGKVTSVKDQNPLDTCWAFATYGSLESNLLPGENTDFSENNLINKHGFDPGPNDGGNYVMSSAYLARWSGPMSENDDKYTGEIHPSPTNIFPIKHVQEIVYLPARQSETDNDSIKSALINHGAINASMYWDDNYYNANTFSYYYPVTGSTTNHSVTIVGWDDNYSSTKFKNPPANNGAFIIKNSWGTSFGEEGYFYISYYDQRFVARAVYTIAEATNNFGNIYQYDPFGFINYVYTEHPVIWMSNMFTAASNNPIIAVGFYTVLPNTICTIKINTDCTDTPDSGVSAGQPQTFTSSIRGYQTIHLDNPVAITAGTKFSVMIELDRSPNNISYVPVEEKINGFSSGVTINPGESFLSIDGDSWLDATLIPGTGNVCLKAYSVSSLPVTTTSISGDLGSNGWYVSDVTVTLTANDSNGFGIAATKYSFNNINWFDYSSPIPITTEGTNNLYFYSIDNLGNVEFENVQTINIDKSKPQIQINVPLDGASYLLNADIQADWSTSDSYSGIDVEEGTVPSGNDIDTSSVGQKTFNVYARDKAGNDITQEVTYNVYENAPTPPTTTISLSGTLDPDGWYTSDVVVTLTAADASGSGIKNTKYSFDNAAWTTYAGPFTITQRGVTTLYYYSEDNDGNVEETKQEIVKIRDPQRGVMISVVTDN